MDEILKNSIGPYAQQAYGFIKEVKKRLKQSDKCVLPSRYFTSPIDCPTESYSDAYHITFTGHSLGAWIASIACSIFHYPSIVFENPGAREIIEEFRKGQVHMALIDPQNFLLINYQAMPNYINTTHRQIGRSLQLTTNANIVSHGISGAINYTLDQHSIDGIVETFNPKTGMPYSDRVKEIRRWPSGRAAVIQELMKLFPEPLRYLTYYFLKWWFTPSLTYQDWITLALGIFRESNAPNFLPQIEKILNKANSYGYMSLDSGVPQTAEEEFKQRFEVTTHPVINCEERSDEAMTG